MQGTVAFSTQARISPAPPRGISRSTSPFARISSCRALVAGVLARMFRMSGSPPDGGDALLEGGDDGLRACGWPRLPAAQDADVAALDGKRRRVGGDVRAALIDDRDQPQRHLLFIDRHTVRALHLGEDPPRVIGQLRPRRARRPPSRRYARRPAAGGRASRRRFVPRAASMSSGVAAQNLVRVPLGGSPPWTGADGSCPRPSWCGCCARRPWSGGMMSIVVMGLSPSFSKIGCRRACRPRCHRAVRACCRWR